MRQVAVPLIAGNHSTSSERKNSIDATIGVIKGVEFEEGIVNVRITWMSQANCIAIRKIRFEWNLINGSDSRPVIV